MILELDVGNSAVKWRVLGPPQGTAADGRCDLADLLADRAGMPGTPFARLRVSCVRGAEVASSILMWSRTRCGIDAEFAQSTRSAAGVRNGYASPERLGVDRWLAILAAYDSLRGAVCVLDFGSAMTADFVDAGGGHRGGIIAPGLAMMQRSLQAGTDRVRFDRIEATARLAPGIDTASAVGGGVLAAVSGFAERARRVAQAIAPETGMVLTGGDAGTVAPLLGFPASLRPALVLDGLALALP